MTTETPEDDETYLPEPCEIMDGAVLLADPLELFELANAHAFIVRDGALYALRRDTMKWVSIESLPKPAGAKLAAIKS